MAMVEVRCPSCGRVVALCDGVLNREVVVRCKRCLASVAFQDPKEPYIRPELRTGT